MTHLLFTKPLTYTLEQGIPIGFQSKVRNLESVVNVDEEREKHNEDETIAGSLNGEGGLLEDLIPMLGQQMLNMYQPEDQLE